VRDKATALASLKHSGREFREAEWQRPGLRGFGDTLRATPPDFYLPLNMEPYVEAEADLNKYGHTGCS